MKKFRFLTWAVMAAATISFSACSDDDTNDDPTPPETEKSKECKITEFKLVLSNKAELAGEIFDFEKVIEVTYETGQEAQLKNATASVKISDKATISPDPTTAADYSKADEPVKFTVTAENGTNKTTYTIEIKEKVLKVSHKFDLVWEKKIGEGIELELTNATNDVSVAASGDKIVLSDGNVYDRTGAKVGTLNTTGLDNTALQSMTNDFNGIMLASIVNENATDKDGENPKKYEIWVWKNGWNQAPQRLLNSANRISRYISISGDFTGASQLTAKLHGTPENGSFFGWSSTNGWESFAYKQIDIKRKDTDGSWGQMISATTSSLDTPYFVYDSENTTDATPSGGYLMANAASKPVLLNGPGCWYTGIDGNKGWGNYTVGTTRAFTIHNKAYGLITSGTWASTYLTVIKPVIDNADEPLYYRNDIYKGTGDQTVRSTACGAYVFDAAQDCGYLYLLTPSSSLACVKITPQYE